MDEDISVGDIEVSLSVSKTSITLTQDADLIVMTIDQARTISAIVEAIK